MWFSQQSSTPGEERRQRVKWAKPEATALQASIVRRDFAGRLLTNGAGPILGEKLGDRFRTLWLSGWGHQPREKPWLFGST